MREQLPVARGHARIRRWRERRLHAAAERQQGNDEQSE
jgi:hypothetical protein